MRKHTVIITMVIDLDAVEADLAAGTRPVTPEESAKREAACDTQEWLDLIAESIDDELGGEGITFTVTRG